MGRHKLAPVISPKKTVEGALGGLGASIVTSLIVKYWLLPSWNYKQALMLGSLLAIMGQLGDLGKSIFKRDAGLKDSGNIIPGHGGILDRVDGLLFSTPVLYYYLIGFGGAS
jgi:phosphatidate cytidylyltransferase